MPASGLQDLRHIDRLLGDLLDATNEAAALTALPALFVEQLDFDSRTGAILLHGDIPPVI